MNYCLILILLAASIQGISCDEEVNCANATSNGEPLILTPYINNGSIELARNKSKVTVQGWSGYSGFFTVDENCGANIFFWFILAKNASATSPVMVWLQGGPGFSSLYGLFGEVGPFNHFNTSGFAPRNLTWCNNNNMIFIDQPVGTGFSFPKNSCLAENMTVVVDHLESLIKQFFVIFPEFRSNKFYLTGESFAGHWIPALAVRIHEKNQNASVKINLAGLIIGNPLTRLACHNYAHFLHNLGFVGAKLRDEINRRHKLLEMNAENGNYLSANDDWYYILNSLIGEKAKFWSRYTVGPVIEDLSDYATWLNTSEARCLLHVGDTDYTDPNWDVYNKLLADIAKSYAPELAAMLEANYSTWIYSGNLDLICLTASTDCLLRGLDWWGAKGFRNANRTAWFHGGGATALAGYYERYGPLNYVIFKDCGHSVPFYKPEHMYYLINSINFCESSYPCYLNITPPEDY